MKALVPRAISLGFLTDMLGTTIVSTLYLALDPRLAALSPEAQSAALGDSPVAWLLGSLMTVAGGFVAGHLAASKEVPNAFAVGAFSTVLLFVSILGAPPAGGPFWVVALSMLLTIPLAIAGGVARAALRRQA